MKKQLLAILACLCLFLCLTVTGALAAGPEPESAGAEEPLDGGAEPAPEGPPESVLIGVRILWEEAEWIRTPETQDAPPAELILTAEAYYSDGRTEDVTEEAQWETDDPGLSSVWFDPDRKGRLCLSYGARGFIRAIVYYDEYESTLPLNLIGGLLPGDFVTDLPRTEEYSGTIHQAAVTWSNPEVEGRFSVLCCTDPEGLTETEGAREAGTYYIFARAAEDDPKFLGRVCLGVLTVEPRALTMTARVEEKVYDGGAEVSVLAGALEGVLDGEQVCVAETAVPGTLSGPDTGTDIPAVLSRPFTLAGAQAGNYVLRQPEGLLGTVLPRDVTARRPAEERVFVPGGAAFAQPEFGDVTGRLAYFFNGAEYDYETLVAALNALPAGSSGEISFRLLAEGNYTGSITGTIRFSVQALRFASGGRPISPGCGFSVLEEPVYGVSLEEIVTLGDIEVSLDGSPGEGRYTVLWDGAAPVPDAGELNYTILFHGSVDGRSYDNIPVWSGTAVVLPRSLSGAEVTGLSGGVYTGSPVTPVPAVVLDGQTLRRGTDYLLTWEENVNAGEALAVLQGIGNYTGAAAGAFPILPADPEIGAVAYDGGELFLDRDPASVRLTRENARVEGTLALDAAAFVSPGPGTYAWTFTPDSGNYRTVRGTVLLDIRNRPAGGGTEENPGGGTGENPGGGTEENPGGGTGGERPGSGTAGNPGGSGNTAPSAPSVPVTSAPLPGHSGLQTAVSPPAVLRDGTACAVLSPETGRELAARAGENGSAAAVIAPEIPEGARSVQVTLPASAVRALGRETGAALVVDLPDVRITIPNGTLLRLPEGALSLLVRRQGDVLSLTVQAGEEVLTRVPGGLTAELPVRGAGPGTAAVLTGGEGAPGVIPRSVMDWERGVLVIPLEGSARVEAADGGVPFGDVPARSWYAAAADFVSARALFCGTAAGEFSPDALMTRGMLAQVLYNLEGRPEPAGSGGFSDVEAGHWYARSSAWAAETGTLPGLEDGRFAPEEPVTRQEVALALWRYAGSPRDGGDAARPGAETQALGWAAEHRVLQGRGGGLDPEGRATRAEAAQMVKNFLERVRG